MRNQSLPTILCLLAGMLSFTVQGWTAESAGAPVALECESAVNPFIDVREPVLSWRLNDPREGAVQSAWRVIAASTPEKLAAGEGDLWDSGKVTGDQSVLVPYAGKPLTSRQRVHWKAKVWDKDGNESGWSEPAYWEMGLLADKDWAGAQWIAAREHEEWERDWNLRKEKEYAQEAGKGHQRRTQNGMSVLEFMRFNDKPYEAAPFFRQEFDVKGDIRQARLYICGLGYYEASLNGKRIGDRVLNPSWTDFIDRIDYSIHDVTKELKEGGNAIGVLLGRGFYAVPSNEYQTYDATYIGQPKLRATLVIEYADGRIERVVTNDSWKTAESEIVFDCPNRGEVHDTRRLTAGWDLAGLDDASWTNAKLAPAPEGALQLQLMPPIRKTREVAPVSVVELSPGEFMFDMGEVVVGWPRISLRGGAEGDVLVTYTTDDPKPLEKDKIWFQSHGVIMADGKDYEFEPHFNYTAFRYVFVSGAKAPMKLEDVTGVMVHTDLEEVGTFESSSALLNAIHQAGRHTLLSNAHSIPTDIPTREKSGWTADGRLSSGTAMNNFDGRHFYAKWIRDIWDSQDEVGNFGEFAPKPVHRGKPLNAHLNPAWSGSGILMPYLHYQFYGDKRLIEEGYERMAKHLAFFEKKAENGILFEPLGDWLSPDHGHKVFATARQNMSPEGGNLYGTAYYYRCAKAMEFFAGLLGRPDDQARYAALASQVAEAFQRKFYDESQGCYRGEERRITAYRQSANAVPLAYGLVPEELRPAIAKGLADDVTSRGDRLNTGILGSPALLESLVDSGYGDLAYRVVAQTEEPSWGHMIKSGKAYISERWNRGQPHLGLNSVGAFFYRHLAGIQPAAPGFKTLRLAPLVPEGLAWVKASHHSPYGEIRSEWTKTDGGLEWRVIVPPNTTAVAEAPRGFTFADGSNEKTMLAGSYDLQLPQKK
jgi:alpha-L-rhamnosidase